MVAWQRCALKFKHFELTRNFRLDGASCAVWIGFVARRQGSSLGLTGDHPIEGVLGARSRREDGALVVFEGFEPVDDVLGVVSAGLRQEAKPGHGVGGAQFADQLFEGILARREALAEVAVETMLAPGAWVVSWALTAYHAFVRSDSLPASNRHSMGIVIVSVDGR